jgi:hypothetical protein
MKINRAHLEQFFNEGNFTLFPSLRGAPKDPSEFPGTNGGLVNSYVIAETS